MARSLLHLVPLELPSRLRRRWQITDSVMTLFLRQGLSVAADFGHRRRMPIQGQGPGGSETARLSPVPGLSQSWANPDRSVKPGPDLPQPSRASGKGRPGHPVTTGPGAVRLEARADQGRGPARARSEWTMTPPDQLESWPVRDSRPNRGRTALGQPKPVRVSPNPDQSGIAGISPDRRTSPILDQLIFVRPGLRHRSGSDRGQGRQTKQSLARASACHPGPSWTSPKPTTARFTDTPESDKVVGG